MRENRTCKHCSKLFKDIEGKVFANHVRWCDKNKTNGDKGSSKLSRAGQKRFDEKLGEKKTFTMHCQKCDKAFDVIEREKKHPERDLYFCSRACSNSRAMTDEKRQHLKNIWSERTVYHDKNCLFCNRLYNGHNDSKFCSRSCAAKAKCNPDRESLSYYRFRCQFKFNLKDYLEEFDFSLIEKYGWYSAKNRGNNLNGVSRDHIISVRYGYDHKIDPSVISHPANCQLLRHNDNVSKNKKCSMTIDELLEKIQQWDDKYNRMGA